MNRARARDRELCRGPPLFTPYDVEYTVVPPEQSGFDSETPGDAKLDASHLTLRRGWLHRHHDCSSLVVCEKLVAGAPGVFRFGDLRDTLHRLTCGDLIQSPINPLQVAKVYIQRFRSLPLPVLAFLDMQHSEFFSHSHPPLGTTLWPLLRT